MENLIEKISDIFFKYGIKSVTMDDIAKELGMSKRTLYRHFDDKNDVVKSFVFYHIENQHIAIHNVLQKDMNAIDRLLELFKLFSSVLNKFHATLIYDLQKFYPDVYKLLLEHKSDNLLDNLLQTLNKGISEGLFRNNIDIEIIARLYINNIEALFNTNIFPPETFNTVKVYKEIYQYHIRGIASKKGIEYFESLIN